MRGCSSTTNFMVLVNGSAKGCFNVTRGLGQRNPLSLFLFTITMDVLSRLMSRAKETTLLEGFVVVGRSSIRISHLQFAGNTIFFSRAYMEELHNLNIILLVFGQISSLKINLNKSTLSGINMNEDQNLYVGISLYCTYLLGGNPKTITFWDLVIGRISRRLDEWEKAFLSLSERITLV